MSWSQCSLNIVKCPFTTVSFKPLSDQGLHKYPSSFNWKLSSGKFEFILVTRFHFQSDMLLYKWRVIWHSFRYFPKGIFPRATSQVRISQVVTSQMCNVPSGNFPKVGLGHLRRRRLQWGGASAAARMWYGAECRGWNILGAERCG